MGVTALRILVIEDNPQNLELFVYLLRRFCTTICRGHR